MIDLHKLSPFLLLFLVVIFFLSPFYFFVSTVFFMTFYDFEKIDFLRIILSILLIVSLIYIYGSIDFSLSEIQDYLNYFQAAQILEGEVISNLFNWPFSPEIGWATIFWFLQKMGLEMTSINQVSLINLTLSLSFFYLWFELHGKEGVPKKYYGLLTASTFLFLSVITMTFLQRQSLSVVVLLFAISNYNKKRFYPYLIVSSLFHISSLPIGLLYKYLINRQFTLKFYVSLLFLFIFVRLFFLKIISVLSFLMQGKADFYLNSSGFSIVSIRLALYSIIYFIVLLFCYRNLDHKFKNIIIFVGVCSFSLLGINLASERLNFITIYLYGYFIFLMLYKKNVKILMIFNMLFLLLFVVEKSGLFFNPTNLWINYSSLKFILKDIF